MIACMLIKHIFCDFVNKTHAIEFYINKTHI